LNLLRVFLAAIGGTIAYFAFGSICFALLPLKGAFQKYPAVYRSEAGIRSAMPVGMLGIFVSILVLAVIYAGLDRHSAGVVEGLRFGALIGVFALGAFVLHNYVNLNIGTVITLQQAVMYFLEWTVVGIVIGLIYKPTAAP
jgi:hypothetical protein